MKSCRNDRDHELYSGGRPYQIDELLCRSCQRSPAVQVRVLLERAREQGFTFERAWVWALGTPYTRDDGRLDFTGGRVRWPHDTSHRVEWKEVLGGEESIRVWRACFERAPVPKDAKPLSLLAA